MKTVVVKDLVTAFRRQDAVLGTEKLKTDGAEAFVIKLVVFGADGREIGAHCCFFCR